MSELIPRLDELRERARPSWTAERERRVRASIERRLLSRKRLRGAGTALLAAALAAFVLVFGQRVLTTPDEPLRAEPERLAPKPSLRLSDGSEVFPRTPETRVRSLSTQPGEVMLQLEAGSARFSVTHDPRRDFRVMAGAVTVNVVGTVFTVTKEADRVNVAVEQGRVRVTGPDGERELGAGQSESFREQRQAEPVPPLAPSAAPVAAPARSSSPWRSLAQDGDYAAAFAELERHGSKAVRDVPDDLLLAADAARLGGKPDQALPFLERVVRRHSHDARAALAAFTLGRTLLDQLGRPRDAAQAFATARRLDGSGAISEDALAREVESWSRAGDAALAREKAHEFLNRYPSGRRAAAVRRLGGLE